MKKRLLSTIVSLCLLLTMAPTVAFAAVAELEREYILQRQREGIAIAKTKANTPAANRDPCQTISSGWSLASVPGKSPPQKPCGRPA